MTKNFFIILILLSMICFSGCTRKPKWDPLLIDQGALESPFTTTASGLKWRLLRNTSGRKPTRTSDFWVHYRGWLIDEYGNESVFDTSYTIGFAMGMNLDSIILGFAEGVQLCPEGGMIELEIPAELGYGAQGSPPSIPPDTTLFFRVEMVEVQ